jgi:hypothetical protein
VRTISRAPAADARPDTAAWGAPQVRVSTRQGTAAIWLLRTADTFFIAAAIPDTTPSWSDALAICFSVGGWSGDAPGHDDFEWSFRRVLDSSVVFRGRGGRWAPPLDDPDWRLGHERSGGGWEIGSSDGAREWTLVLRLDPVWLEGEQGRRPAVGFLLHDDDPSAWYAWPGPNESAGATLLERTPALWVPLDH